MNQRLAIGIDLGATNIKGVLLDSNGNILEEGRKETNEQNEEHWKTAVRQMILNFSNKHQNKINAIGLSAPGLADVDNKCIACMPGRLAGIENFNWSEFIGQRVAVLNDAHAALMAEAAFGAAKGMEHAVLLTLGTGVGGGILINGQLYQGQAQMAGHLGHVTVNAGSHQQDVTGMPGSIENAIGNTTLSRRSQGKYQSTEALVKDFEKGDPFASWLWLSSVRNLAVSLASFINILSPEVIILSGGMIQAKDALMKPLQEYLGLYEWRPGGKQTPIRFAHFSDMAGAIGAAGFALSKLK